MRGSFVTLLSHAMKKYLQTLYNKAVKNSEDNIFSLLEYNSKAILLDCGCSDGGTTLKFATKIGTQNIFGMEVVKELIDKARKREINVRQADLNDIFPFKNESIDVLIANQVIEHLYNTNNFISEIYRVLRRGGYAVISTENLASWHNIFPLFFGCQPFSLTNISKHRLGIGNPFALHRGKNLSFPSWQHIKVFAYQGLKEIFEVEGFKIARILGAGYYPLPNFLARLNPRHAAFLTFKIRKI